MALPAEQDLLQSLPELTSVPEARFWVAYSGGLDSQVLLDIARRCIPPRQLRAVHINHGLQAEADSWEQHCRDYCQLFGISFTNKKILVEPSQESLESAARRARYQVFESLLGEADYLLLAHHQDDQAETVLYHLMRGSGLRGLSGIPAQRTLAQGQLIRPLLPFSKPELREYAEGHQLSWMEDHSNRNTDFDRNFLRQQVLPLLKQRWPEAVQSIQRSAGLAQEAEHLLAVLAQIDATGVIDTDKNSIALAGLKNMEASRQRNLLRYWFGQLHARYAIPVPGFNELSRLVNELIPAAEDALPLVSWSREGVEVQARRFQDRLYVLKNFSGDCQLQALPINPGDKIDLPANLGKLNLRESEHGIAISENDCLEIRFASEQKSVRPQGRRSRSFKKIYQDYKVPPWMRDRMPLLFRNGKLVAVADLFVVDGEDDERAENHVILCWERAG